MASERPPIMMVRRGDQLHPLSPFDGESLRAYPASKPLRVEPKMPRRSSPQNRLYWSLLRLVCENLDSDVKPKTLHVWLKGKLGVVEAVPLRNGGVDYVPSSTAFDEMDHGEFTEYFAKVKALLCDQIIPGLNSDVLEREARAMLGEAA